MKSMILTILIVFGLSFLATSVKAADYRPRTSIRIGGFYIEVYPQYSRNYYNPYHNPYYRQYNHRHNPYYNPYYHPPHYRYNPYRR